MTVLVILLLSIVVILALALWILVRTAARRVVMPRTPKMVALMGTPAPGRLRLALTPETRLPGKFGLWLDGGAGHARIGRVLAIDEAAGTVDRAIEAVSWGDPTASRLGQWTGRVYASPKSLEVPFQDVQIQTPCGSAPAWIIPPDAPDSAAIWAVHVHGIRTTRSTALRSVPVARSLGFTSLVPSFRGDSEGPETRGNSSTLGQDEWADLDAAISYAFESGARAVILFGWSMGATMSLLAAEKSQFRGQILGLVLIAPVTCWRELIMFGTQQAHLPRIVGAAAAWALGNRLLSRWIGTESPIK